MKLFQYNKDDVKKTLDMAWPAILESFFAAFAGLVDSLMVSSNARSEERFSRNAFWRRWD